MRAQLCLLQQQRHWQQTSQSPYCTGALLQHCNTEACGNLREKQCRWCHTSTVKVCPFQMLSVFWGPLLGKGEPAHLYQESIVLK